MDTADGTTGGVPPGWYPDPAGNPGWRWWDGHRWGPLATAPAPGFPPWAQAGAPPWVNAEPVHPATGRPYASFWLRFAALLIDNLILTVPVYLLMFLVLIPMMLVALSGASEGDPTAGVAAMVVFLPLIWLVMIGGQVFYFVWFESRKGGTPGKRVLGLRVVDIGTGGLLTTARAFGRYFGRFVSALAVYIGYFVMLSHPQRQTWHDQWTRAVVIRER
jgi:uncharacterized RDD family membrane protein YckC